jgi:hypothetical protein
MRHSTRVIRGVCCKWRDELGQKSRGPQTKGTGLAKILSQLGIKEGLTRAPSQYLFRVMAISLSPPFYRGLQSSMAPMRLAVSSVITHSGKVFSGNTAALLSLTGCQRIVPSASA